MRLVSFQSRFHQCANLVSLDGSFPRAGIALWSRESRPLIVWNLLGEELAVRGDQGKLLSMLDVRIELCLEALSESLSFEFCQVLFFLLRVRGELMQIGGLLCCPITSLRFDPVSSEIMKLLCNLHPLRSLGCELELSRLNLFQIGASNGESLRMLLLQISQSRYDVSQSISDIDEDWITHAVHSVISSMVETPSERLGGCRFRLATEGSLVDDDTLKSASHYVKRSSGLEARVEIRKTLAEHMGKGASVRRARNVTR